MDNDQLENQKKLSMAGELISEVRGKPQLPDAAVTELSNQLFKVSSRVKDKGKHLKNDLLMVLEDFYKDYSDGREKYNMESALGIFIEPWVTQAVRVEQQRFIDSLSAKIHEVAEAEKTSQ